ncbi:MAG: protein-disulfide reductase DsbD domain-containing protein [Candidatus Binatia bacterium]
MVIAVVLTLLLAASARAAGPKLDAKWQKAGGSELTLTVTLERGWHLNANDPDRSYLIPTTLEITPLTGSTVESIRYPDAVVHSLAFAAGTALRLYEGTFAIRVKLGGALPPRFDAQLAYQACSDETCLPPATLAVPYEGAP